MSQDLGRYGVSSPYHRKRASRHYYAPSSLLFTADNFTVSHALVFFIRRKWRASWTGVPARVSTSASYDLFAFLVRTISLPSLRNSVCFTVFNPPWPLIAAMICPVMTQYAVQFSVAFIVGSGRAIPTCLTGRRGTPRHYYIF